MYLKILSEKIKYGASHTFDFTEKVQKFIVGFSKFRLEYKSDHHVRQIKIDLTEASSIENRVTVIPKISMTDDSGNKPVADSSYIFVTVAALIGSDDSNMYMQNCLDIGQQRLTFSKPKFILAGLSWNEVSFVSDHHVSRYSSNVAAQQPSDQIYSLYGETMISDTSGNKGTGNVKGSVIAYKGTSDCVMCGVFTQENKCNSNAVLLGKKPSDYQDNGGTWQYGFFVSSYSVEYPGSDHHVRYIEISAKAPTDSSNKAIGPRVENEKVYINADVSAKICDNSSSHETNVPENKVSGFVLAYYEKNKQNQ